MKIAILGSGLMGRVLSFVLYRNGYTNITLIDKDQQDGQNSAAYIAAGMLAPFCESVFGGSLIYELGTKTIILWSEYLQSLNIQSSYNKKGTLLLANQNFVSEVTHYLAKISFHINDCMINNNRNYILSNHASANHKNFYSLLDKSKILSLEPELNFSQGYFLPHEASLNARKIFKGLGEYLFSRIEWHTGVVLNSLDFKTLFSKTQIKINDNYHVFDYVVDCRGTGSKELFSDLRGVRGELVRVYAPDVNISRPIRLFHPRHNIYINPYGDNHYIIGATELEVEDYSSVSVKSCFDLIAYACNVHSGFAEARIIELGSNCRPTLSDNLPNIKIINENNFIAVNGLYRHGYLIAPALAEIVKTYLITGIKLNSQIWS